MNDHSSIPNTCCCMNLTELSFSWADVRAHSRQGIKHPTTLYISRVFLLLSSLCILSLFTRFSPSIFQHLPKSVKRITSGHSVSLYYVLNCAILLKSLNLFKGATYALYTIKFGNPDGDQLSGDQSVEWNVAECEVAGVRSETMCRSVR